MSSTTDTDTDNAFPYTGIPSTQVVREPGHTGMAEHGSDITKHLLQEANDRVEHKTEAVASQQQRATQLRDAARRAADGVRARARANPLTAMGVGVVLGLLLARLTQR